MCNVRDVCLGSLLLLLLLSTTPMHRSAAYRATHHEDFDYPAKMHIFLFISLEIL